VEDLPKKIQELLEKISDIVVDEFPSSLPPVISIIHNIDLIPGENLPNKVSYSLTP
jgi:hypothetical protein